MSELFKELSKRERQILELVIEKDSITAVDLESLLPEKISNSTIRTLLRILVGKNKLKIEKVGSQYHYFPNFEIKEAKKSFFETLKKTFFGGSSYQAAVSFIDDEKNELTTEELNRLEDLIKKVKEGRNV